MGLAQRCKDLAVLRRAVVAVVVSAALSAGFLAPSASAAGPDGWAAALGDAGNTGTNAGETAVVAATASRVAQAWTAPTRSASPAAPAVVDGVALRVVPGVDASAPSSLVGTSPTSGATLWQVELPGEASYDRGVTVAGSSAVIPFSSTRRPGGVLVVDLTRRVVVWTRALPSPGAQFAWAGNRGAGQAYTDGQRVFVSGSDQRVIAYRLTDGALLWSRTISIRPDGVPTDSAGLAVGDGRVFLGSSDGLVALDAVTGQQLWTGPGGRWPVVAGGRVITTAPGEVTASSTAGCGRATCPAQWTAAFPVNLQYRPEVAGADGSTLFVTTNDGSAGTVTRLATATGARQWSATVGHYVAGLVRGGDAVWAVNEYVLPSGAVSARLVAFATAATGSAPLTTLALPTDRQGFPQQLAVAAGTLFQQVNGRPLVGYRVGAAAPDPVVATVAADSFRRTASNGLGTADTGGAWTSTAGAGRTSVSPGAASIALTPGSAARAHLGGVSRSSVDVTATLSLTAAPTGGGVSTYLVARRTGTDQEYRLRARFLPDGTLRLAVTALTGSASERVVGAEVTVAGVRPTVGTPVNLRLQVSGQGTTTLSGRAWTGTTEPAGWAVTRTDTSPTLQQPGSVGLGAYLSSSAAATPVAVRVSAYRVVSAG
ncbi:outer membrane protein assembly factor BamB family protein [Klenkia taihuensis]|uniref:Outer membrane protein assembly factor BamB, contains PQQ-like beta-propeller repeat n=1 Tax=Klenkia taihuensis TaxID=1225127 RepID=A0A1I1SKN0_9ACTN|nr:PQQ-binding-like beta-propeller repeat protein [Klenkia taihuensis]GHE13372.1 hypothetical protein GCM10011381_35280 [Klenkia taihuensis]SFD46862.1 Outer membrane protein assembly factor BamB, contains PQQ-like beta-propeller repeat [Klenkia taihuensis]